MPGPDSLAPGQLHSSSVRRIRFRGASLLSGSALYSNLGQIQRTGSVFALAGANEGESGCIILILGERFGLPQHPFIGKLNRGASCKIPKSGICFVPAVLFT